MQTQVFIKNDQQVLNASGDYILAHKHSAELLLKLGKYMNLSFNSSDILFDKQILKHMKNHIEKLHNQPWQNALQICAQNLCANELYANYMLIYYANKAAIVHERSTLMPPEKSVGIEWQRRFLARYYKAVAFNH